jgi:hypothetical protein
MSIQAVSSQPMSVLQSQFARDNVNTQIAVSVIKQIQDTQTNQGQALVNMIQQSTPQGTGQILNILA